MKKNKIFEKARYMNMEANQTISDEKIKPILNLVLHVILMTIYVAFSFVGLVGITLLIWFLSRNKKKMKKIADIFRLNLIIADLFICLIHCPFKVCIN